MDLNNMNEEERKETIKEARILEALKHPNIVRFREVYKTKKGNLKKKYFFFAIKYLNFWIYKEN
jgi:serine/threonine protein kinase